MVGEAIRKACSKYNLKLSDVFVTTKLGQKHLLANNDCICTSLSLSLAKCYRVILNFECSPLRVKLLIIHVDTGSQGYSNALSAFETSLQALGKDYVDLYLIHWPGVRGKARDDPANAKARRGSWRALEELYQAGVFVSKTSFIR